MALLSKPMAGISNLRHSILMSSSVIAMTSETVKGGRWVVGSFLEEVPTRRVLAILTERCRPTQYTRPRWPTRNHRNSTIMTGPNSTKRGLMILNRDLTNLSKEWGGAIPTHSLYSLSAESNKQYTQPTFPAMWSTSGHLELRGHRGHKYNQTGSNTTKH